MNEVASALAKLAGIKKSLETVLYNPTAGIPTQNFEYTDVGRYFVRAAAEIATLRSALPHLFSDLEEVPTEADLRPADSAERMSRSKMVRLVRDIEEVFEIRANSEIGAPAAPAAKRVFISHGRAQDWREVQAYIEKDVGLETAELAQEPNAGRTILAKLCECSDLCDSAVIVMTGDDKDDAGVARARENVMHEIGFFQGKYGLSRVCLLHEEGVSIPSNIQGLVYSGFPKGLVSATFGLLHRELKAMYR